MHAFELVGPNDGVGKSSSIFKNEDGGIRSGVDVGVARTSAVKLLVAHILEARDGRWFRERDDGPTSCRDIEGLGRDRGGQDSSKDSRRELHFESVGGWCLRICDGKDGGLAKEDDKVLRFSEVENGSAGKQECEAGEDVADEEREGPTEGNRMVLIQSCGGLYKQAISIDRELVK